MYVNFETKKIKEKNIKIIYENKKKSKNILTPEVNIKTDQLKKTKRVCPISGCNDNNNAIPKVIIKEHKYFI